MLLTAFPLPGRMSNRMLGPCNSTIDMLEASVRCLPVALVFFLGAGKVPVHSQEKQTKASGHYLFAWTGDDAKKGNDFLAVIDADPDSASYGRLMTTLVTDHARAPHRVRDARERNAFCERSRCGPDLHF
jgi:hypothetical protein